jgi:hypothetical protein
VDEQQKRITRRWQCTPTKFNKEVLTRDKSTKHNKEALMNIENAQEESVNEQQQ